MELERKVEDGRKDDSAEPRGREGERGIGESLISGHGCCSSRDRGKVDCGSESLWRKDWAWRSCEKMPRDTF